MPKGRFHNPYFKREDPVKTTMKRDGFALLGSLILLVALLYVVLGRWHVLSAQSIAISGEQYLTVDDIADATRQALQQRRWLVLKQRFLPVLDEQAVSEAIKTTLSQKIQLESVVVTTDWPSRVNVTVAERVPGYVYINGKQYYYLDVQGAITQVTTEGEADPHFPHIREGNKKRKVAIGDSIVGAEVVDFVSRLHDQFTTASDLDIAEYAIMPVTCQEKQFVTEKIFADEIDNSKNESSKQQKRKILDQLRNNTITVDQSLDLLAEIKHSESGDDGADTSGSDAFIQYDAEYVNVQCDYPAVIRDISVVTQQGVSVYFDTGLDLDDQLNHLKQILSSDIEDPSQLDYIDLRFTDRVYYK
jgi:cell division septal protein FtsQ